MDKGTKQSQTCYNCGGTYPHEGMPCRVTRKACHNCLKTGHFVRDCKSEHKQPFRKPRAPQNQYQSQANRLNPLNQDPQHQTLPLEITAQGAPEDSNRMLIKMPNSLLSIVTHASHSDMVTPPHHLYNNTNCPPNHGTGFTWIFVVRFPQRKQYLSLFPEVEIMKSTRASAVTNQLDRIFAVHGIPSEIYSDNGPPFASDAMKQFM